MCIIEIKCPSTYYLSSTKQHSENRNNPQYSLWYVSEISKTVRKLLRDDVREYSTMRVKEGVETGKGLKKATNKED